MSNIHVQFLCPPRRAPYIYIICGEWFFNPQNININIIGVYGVFYHISTFNYAKVTVSI